MVGIIIQRSTEWQWPRRSSVRWIWFQIGARPIARQCVNGRSMQGSVSMVVPPMTNLNWKRWGRNTMSIVQSQTQIQTTLYFAHKKSSRVKMTLESTGWMIISKVLLWKARRRKLNQEAKKKRSVKFFFWKTDFVNGGHHPLNPLKNGLKKVFFRWKMTTPNPLKNGPKTVF